MDFLPPFLKLFQHPDFFSKGLIFSINLDVLKVTKDNLDDAGDREDVPDPYEALNDDVNCWRK